MANVTTTLTYDISDTAGNACNQPVLVRELVDAGLTALARRDGTNIFVDFMTLVTEAEKTTCDSVIQAHQGLPFNSTSQDSNDPTEHTIEVGDWVEVGVFNTGPLPAGKYITQWSAEGKVESEGIGNRIEIRLVMWGVAEASNDALGLPAYQQYQAGAWLSRRAGESFVYSMQAKAVGCVGSVRRIRFGMTPSY